MSTGPATFLICLVPHPLFLFTPTTSSELGPSGAGTSYLMDISQCVVGAEDIDVLSRYQVTNFFHRQKSVTKNDCDRTAGRITGCQVSPTLVQGETSYTVAADTSQLPKVVQFRRSALNLELMNQARQTYGEFVPNCKPYGMLADVYVYEMDFVPGVAFSRARRQFFSSGMEQCLLRTVQDFARSVGMHIPISASSPLIGRIDSSHQRG